MTYIADKEIEKIDWTIVYFKDGTSCEYTETSIQYIVSEEPKDPTEFQQIIINNVLPEIEACLVGDDISEISSNMLLVFEKHDVTNSNIQKIVSLITTNLIERHNEILKEKAWEEIEQFKKDMEKYKEITKTIWDSYENWLMIAMGKAFGTYEDWKHASIFLDNIRISNLKKYLL